MVTQCYKRQEIIFLCAYVELGNPKVAVPQGQLKAMMLRKKMESEVKPVFLRYLPAIFLFMSVFMIYAFPHHLCSIQ